MNTRIFSVKTSSLYRQARYLVLVSTSVLLAACATAPQPPTAQLLTAEQAIASAEQAQVNRFTSTELSTARTREAANARADASVARQDAMAARSEAEQAREQSLLADGQKDQALTEAARARDDVRAARQQAEQSAATAADLRAQIAELNARPTELGLVVTLGDMLFSTGQAELKASSSNHLLKLAGFLTAQPERTALIAGHTDNVGTTAFNQLLSQRRADAVKEFLVMQGVASSRLSTIGNGLDMPLASNNTAEGRAQNRRVEVTILNPTQ